jgi:hypothetical protein
MTLPDILLWALTKTAWWTFAAAVCLALVSRHQGVVVA